MSTLEEESARILEVLDDVYGGLERCRHFWSALPASGMPAGRTRVLATALRLHPLWREALMGAGKRSTAIHGEGKGVWTGGDRRRAREACPGGSGRVPVSQTGVEEKH